ncbi:hypothetical protein Vadar_027969 [Vaccinium darrowii]|uniref:Uncharacterized protein n=1 Tax=Vaccinium darrowii TaxID=229202 RepID=A0ACB7XKF3_9ERIC|nr:hypothetical protein Vadar_027969 [Vaccinium darrowii]
MGIYDAIMLSKRNIDMDKGLFMAVAQFGPLIRMPSTFELDRCLPLSRMFASSQASEPMGRRPIASSLKPFPFIHIKPRPISTIPTFYHTTRRPEREMWASFLISRDLLFGLSTSTSGNYQCGAEFYHPAQLARQFGLLQMVPTLPIYSKNEGYSHRPVLTAQILEADWWDGYVAEQFADPIEEILSKIALKDKEKSSRQTSKATTTSTATTTKKKEVDTASTVTGQKRKGLHSEEHKQASCPTSSSEKTFKGLSLSPGESKGKEIEVIEGKALDRLLETFRDIVSTTFRTSGSGVGSSVQPSISSDDVSKDKESLKVALRKNLRLALHHGRASQLKEIMKTLIEAKALTPAHETNLVSFYKQFPSLLDAFDNAKQGISGIEMQLEEASSLTKTLNQRTEDWKDLKVRLEEGVQAREAAKKRIDELKLQLKAVEKDLSQAEINVRSLQVKKNEIFNEVNRSKLVPPLLARLFFRSRLASSSTRLSWFSNMLSSPSRQKKEPNWFFMDAGGEPIGGCRRQESRTAAAMSARWRSGSCCNHW